MRRRLEGDDFNNEVDKRLKADWPSYFVEEILKINKRGITFDLYDASDGKVTLEAKIANTPEAEEEAIELYKSMKKAEESSLCYLDKETQIFGMVLKCENYDKLYENYKEEMWDSIAQDLADEQSFEHDPYKFYGVSRKEF